MTNPFEHSRIDLNLLRYLEALIEERHVSHAAERAEISQPAMSLALKRLRLLFNDQLLIQTSKGMVPTPRAMELAVSIRAITQQTRQLLEPALIFDPSTCAEQFVLMAPGTMSTTLLAPLISRLETDAPGIQLVVKPPTTYRYTDWFENFQVDVGLTNTSSPPPSLHARLLYEEEWVCIASKKHSSLQDVVSTDTLISSPFIRVRPPHPPYISKLDRVLAVLHLDLNSTLMVADYSLVPEVVSQTDMISIVPAHVFAKSSVKDELQRLALPLALPPIKLSMLWHARTHTDPARMWFRQIVREVIGDAASNEIHG